MGNLSESYQVKLLNGLVVNDLSEKQLRDGINSGKYLPSDFISTEDGWIHLKDSAFLKKKQISRNPWMALFIISFILNVLMLFLIFWQKGRIEQFI